MIRVPRTNSRHPLRSRGGRGGNREHSAPATVTPPASKVRHPSQLLPEQRDIHLVEVKYCEDSRPKNQLEASKQQHRDLCRDSSLKGLSSSHPPYRSGIHGASALSILISLLDVQHRQWGVFSLPAYFFFFFLVFNNPTLSRDEL
eukprot:1156613-Pelagomonas_calceolata.AAC.6